MDHHLESVSNLFYSCFLYHKVSSRFRAQTAVRGSVYGQSKVIIPLSSYSSYKPRQTAVIMEKKHGQDWWTSISLYILLSLSFTATVLGAQPSNEKNKWTEDKRLQRRSEDKCLLFTLCENLSLSLPVLRKRDSPQH